MEGLVLRVRQNPGTIELNFDELNRQMDAKLAEYKGAVFTEETKDIAKGELASLRRLKEDVESARKATKKEWMKPLDAFEAQMKALSSKVDEPINLIDGQLKEFEKKRKEEKRGKIVGIYEELIGDMREYLPLEKIYEKRWENATTTMKSIQESISGMIDSTRTAVATISSMQSDAVEEAIGLYKNTLDMAKAIAYINDYERKKAEIMRREEERRKREEERRLQAEIERAKAAEREAIAREERARKEAEEQAAIVAEEQKHEEEGFLPEPDAWEEDILPFTQPTTLTAFFKVVATPEELEQVEMTLNSFGIWFERRDA